MNYPDLIGGVMRLCLFALIMVLMVGCSSNKIYATRMNLVPGVSKKEVLATLGKPAQWEIYEKMDQTRVEYLMYPGFNNYEDMTPMCFINNKLVGWGKTFYLDHISESDKRLK